VTKLLPSSVTARPEKPPKLASGSVQGTASWVLWKLDGGLEHILVDEAQDTSPAQWQVVRALSEEFFAGEGARDRERTVFVVGDEKQSIYSFQGADPAAFGDMRAHFEARLAAMGRELQDCALIHSFRSAPQILALVDAVFGGRAGMGTGGAPTHAAIDPARPGRVELWPFLPKPEKPEQTDWWLPVDARSADDPVEILTRQIAERIAGWIADGQLLPGENGARPIRAGDVMILVQRRSALFHAVIRALKREGVAVAGADVLRMGGELAVKDLLAALRVAATPGDDLSLAALLRSPLGGISEDGLFEIAHGRSGSLFAALRRQPPERHAPVRAMLDDLRDQADFLRPFELLQRILLRHDGRQNLVARLGPEAEDGIDALLDQALAYESAEAPSLTGFLAWIDQDEFQVKRRSEEGADQVRVMTVHGAKGLESPVVVLPDCATRKPPEEGRILTLPDRPAVWRGTRADRPPTVAEAVALRARRAEEERRRLLYVALT
ncbi:MAG: UvrD-helicase domain-containing protein, partial [Rhodobacteraceae bacterium]|nr:UvrD-helicase domain-containing protein [Paracoccaceae bacterium]